MQMTPKEAVTAALDKCASEPVHIPGTIQPHGAILAVDNETLTVTHSSANLSAITGLEAETVLGRSIYDVFPSGLRHDLVNNLLPSFLGQNTRLIEHLTLNGYPLFAGAAAAGDATIFEFEPQHLQREVTNSALSQIAFLTSQLHGVSDRRALFEKSVKLLQALTGYQRVMVYELDTEGNGKVQAEALSGAQESFLGLRFPAWDIPAQAREIMRKTPLRYIGDVSAKPAAVLAAAGATPPLDMTHTHLRGVSAVHLRYLQNMKTAATFTLNIVVEDQLWGMISMHHNQPRVPDQSIREVCRSFIRLFELCLDNIIQRERLDRLHSANALTKDLEAEVTNASHASLLDARMLDRLCASMNADGAVLLQDGAVMTSGTQPAPDRLARFATFAAAITDTFASHRLAQDHPQCAACLGDEFAGAYVIPLQAGRCVAFLRRDRDQETAWAGAPVKTIEGQGADARLTPRGSFAAYKETVKGTALPWTAEEHQTAKDVWAILRKPERTALIRQTRQHQRKLHDELNHRVRNILTLVRSLSRQSRGTAQTIDEYVDTLEARIAAVAAAHSLAVQRPEAFVGLQQIFEMTAAPFNADQRRVVLTGDDAGVRPDVAPVFALAVHELMTNAAQHGALSDSTGTVAIHLHRSADGMRIDWHEDNGPPISKPITKGFGTTLVTTTLPKEIGGRIQISYPAEGCRISLHIPQRMLSHDAMLATSPPSVVYTPSDHHASRAELRCLLVEDSFVVSMDTSQIMAEVGLSQIDTAMTLADALDRITKNPPDFAVLDVNLSGGETSYPVAQALFDRGLPFVFVTGYGAEGVPSDAFPGHAVLQKPLSATALDAALQEIGL